MDQQPTGTTLGRYRLDRELGAGGMGTVYAATDLQFDRQVALKLVHPALAEDPGFVARFRREATLLARLDSPHVVSIYDHGTVEGVHFLAAQLIRGGDLEQLLRERGPMPPAVAMGLVAQMASALAAVHGAGIVHRDIKPHNVLVRDPDAAQLHAYLSDFGIASGGGATRLTRTGSFLGSVSYTAPEVARGEEAGTPADIYALGCVLWACVSGRAPYQGAEADVLLAHLDAPVPQLPGTDPGSRQVNRVLDLAMAKDPADRFPSAEAMLAALQPDADPGSTRVRARPQVPGRPAAASTPGPPRRRIPLAVGALALLLAGGSALGYALTREDPPAERAEDSTEVVDLVPSPVAGDVDGDGLGDVIGFVRRGEDLDVARWSSTGSAFSNPAVVPWSEGGTAWVDADVDGVLDRVELTRTRADAEVIATTTLSSDDSRHKLGTGIRFDEGFPRYVKTASGDFNGDYRVDVAVMYEDSDGLSIEVMLNTSAPFRTPYSWWAPQDELSLEDVRILAGDWDGDGQDDLALLAPMGRRDGKTRWGVELLPSSGGGFAVLQERKPLPSGLGPGDVVAGDIDGSGTKQLVGVLALGDGRVRVEVLDLTGLRPKPVRQQTVRLPARGSGARVTEALSDVDGDGAADLVLIPMVRSRRAQPISVMLAGADGFADPVTWGTQAASVDDWVSLAPSSY